MMRSMLMRSSRLILSCTMSKSKDLHQIGETINCSPSLSSSRVAPEAIGGLQQDLPRNYYRSPAFIGTLVATCLAQISGYLGWVL
jgi:hypothetical protein